MLHTFSSACISLAAPQPGAQGEGSTALIAGAAFSWAAKAQASSAIWRDGSIAGTCQFSDASACRRSAACTTSLVASVVGVTGK